MHYNEKILEDMLRNFISKYSVENLGNLIDDCFPIETAFLIKKIFKENSREFQYILSFYNLRISDIPTEIDSDENKIWRNEKGQYHREDGPAFESADGTKRWYVNGQRHRIDGPAIEKVNGYKEWWVDGLRHREDGPAIESGCYKLWYVNGVFIREEF